MKKQTTPKNTKAVDSAPIENFRNARSSREDTYEIGESRVRVTSRSSGVAVAIDDRTRTNAEEWTFRKGSAVMCRSAREAEAIAFALYCSESLRQSAVSER